MYAALQKLLFIDKRSKDLTAKGKIIYAICTLFLWLPAVLAAYTYLSIRVGDTLGFIIAYVMTNWLASPVKEGLYSRFTFTAEAAELKRKSEIFKMKTSK